jgi:hypothetical protein
MTPQERAEFIADVAAAIQAAPAVISDEELQWVRLAIKREAQSFELRQAIIQKTLGGLAWSAIVGVGYLLIDFFKNHGFK